VERFERAAGLVGVGLLGVAVAGCVQMPVTPPTASPRTPAPAAASAPAPLPPAATAVVAPPPPTPAPRPPGLVAGRPRPPAAKPAVAATAAPKPAAPAAPPPAAPPPAAATPALDLAALEQRLRDTKAIGVFTKLSLKNQVDDLLGRFRDFYGRKGTATLAELRQKYDLLLLKVLSVLQDGDPGLAATIAASREAIWGILADPVKFSKLQA
jgi:hypothetical protein